MSEVEHVLAAQNELGEGPVWSVDEAALYWVDIPRHCFYRWQPATGALETFPVGLPVGALALRAAGGVVLATKQGFALYDTERRIPHFIADPEVDKPNARFNDGKVDRHGRFWAGTMADDESPTSALYRLDPDGSVHRVISEVIISNGIGWSPDGRTMYYTDSPRRVIYAYNFDAETGAISNRREFVHTPGSDDVPDGLTVDSEGFVWSARWDGWRVIRYDPDGRVEREVRLPVQRPTSCIFGGPDLDELYITSAKPAPAQRAAQPLAGDLFRLKTDVKGLPEPKFAG